MEIKPLTVSPNPEMVAQPPQMNHGGHEMFDVHEVLSGTIGVLDQYTMFRQHVKDPELADILNRQYNFMLNDYNMLVQAFQTGQDPAQGTKTYMMNQENNFIYGLKPSAPKTPMRSANEINDQRIAGQMLGMQKTCAGQRAVAACEVTNPVVRRVIADSVPNCIEMAYELSLYANKKGWYQVPQLSAEDMQQMMQSYGPAQGAPNQNPTMMQ
ncbi:spore coat protein [Lihuaxuella thermophila]|uniref:Spore coat protein CotF n=1 Tax=Lihuaxuella thermophila TaxID=1173111 RepID=A0A1H8CUC2_9BACL|nr:spore coat protein [Lihuaxuella thermophila]SEM98580.1 Spore coat protein CotF [Lihuaxuella thermophila]